MTKTACVRLVISACLASLPFGAAAQEESGEAKKFYEELITAPIVPPREVEAIQSDLDNAKKEVQESDKAIADANARVMQASGWIATQKKEIDAMKPKIEAAKKEKRDADKLMLEAQKKQLELVADYLGKTKDVRDSEVDLAKAQKDLAESQVKVYEAELDLRKKAESLNNASISDPNLSSLALEASRAAENTLTLMKTMADKNSSVAGRMTKVADRRVSLVQARNKLMTEDRIRNVIERNKTNQGGAD